ncbi:MAG: hypothetical protein ABS36_04985 [Acidobacteria bacterium SCN 69-37]|nr:MAG: hypothetical protein ABS36_04985 [Acidobacteria bacterium SCN 69-37]
MKVTIIAALSAIIMASVVGLSAHDEYRIIGTVTKISAATLTVKQSKDGKVFTMKTDANTIVTRDKKKVARTEMKTGAYVVVDALGDSLEDLVVLEVRIVPAPTAK